MTWPRRPMLVGAVTATVAMVAVAIGWYDGGSVPGPMQRFAVVSVGAVLLGGFVLWHRPGNRYGRVHLALGPLFGSVVLAAAALSNTARLEPWAVQVALSWSWLPLGALLLLWVAAIATFPDGHFHLPALRGAAVGLGIVTSVLAVVGYLTMPAGARLPLISVDGAAELAGPLAVAAPRWLFIVAATMGGVLGTAAPVGAVLALLHRYRRSGLVVRQQIKWLLLAAAVSVALQAIPAGRLGDPWDGARALLVLLAVPLPLLAAGLAIFRYGLWEIDVVVSKSLVYTVCSAVLAAVFLATAFLAGLSLAGSDAQVVTALGLALVVSFAAQPVRERLEARVARALFGDRPRGLLALSRLHGSRAEDRRPEPAWFGRHLAEVTRELLEVQWAGTWLYSTQPDAGHLRPAGAAGPVHPHAVVVPEQAASGLRTLAGARRVDEVPDGVAALLRSAGAEPDLAVSLMVEHELVGLLLCGPRAAGDLSGDDVELLSALARESALTLRNLHLEDELRGRLGEIEQQAAELRRSRQRLVGAQDEERRRIERDLHDGAQQQLVVLAAALRQLATTPWGPDRGRLEELADEAEEAVFALQELARGIYPSLLSDRGLAAALRAHGARLPVNVRVEVGPSLSRRRLPGDLESTLYYVALEAMTNAVKHAPGHDLCVSVSQDVDARHVVLEVHDDGPGIGPDAPGGSGLQNMADRVSAIGGMLTVESEPGAGTWIRAVVPESATVHSITERDATREGRSAPPPPAG